MCKVNYLVTLQSFTDIITNSSSVEFVMADSERTEEEILNLLESIQDDGCSGMGGDISVNTVEDLWIEKIHELILNRGLQFKEIYTEEDYNKYFCTVDFENPYRVSTILEYEYYIDGNSTSFRDLQEKHNLTTSDIIKKYHMEYIFGNLTEEELETGLDKIFYISVDWSKERVLDYLKTFATRVC